MPDLLYCADPLDLRKVDEHFRAEAALARDLGGSVARIDHDALLRGDAAEAVRRVERGSGPYWYRGWMIPSARYAELERALADRDCSLLTSAPAYSTAHELPGWYDALAAATPASSWLPLAPGGALTDAELDTLVAGLPAGAAIVKDYVKSRKHDWDTACFVPTLPIARRYGRWSTGSSSSRMTRSRAASYSAPSRTCAAAPTGAPRKRECGGWTAGRSRSAHTRTARTS